MYPDRNFCSRRLRPLLHAVGSTRPVSTRRYHYPLCLGAIYIYVTPIVYRVANVGNDTFRKYAGFEHDAVIQLKVTFASAILFPTVLWAVKLSLMSISRRVIRKQPDLVRRWECSTGRDERAQYASFLFVIIADIFTDVLIMVFPIIVLRRAQLKRSIFLRTSVIFSVGALCIITSTCRAIVIGVLMKENIPTFPWLAFWDLLDCSIAVIVACLPSYAAHYIWITRRHKCQSSNSYALGSSIRGNKFQTITTIQSTPPGSSHAEKLLPEAGEIVRTYDVRGAEDGQIPVGEENEVGYVWSNSDPAGKTSSDAQYIVLGKLVLPRPPDHLRALAKELEPHLQALNDRDMKDLHNCPIADLNIGFQKFKEEECRVWRTIFQQEMPPTHLVKPSGSLSAQIAHHLNQPPFTTENLEDGQTADKSNGCIAMVMGNLYQEDTLLFDHVHRRGDSKSEAIDKYDPRVLRVHEKFTSGIWESMKAKVELVYGYKVQQRLM
ncbi:hypothetical protein PISL3812_09211 [Talaromyces islandicus]|uniref:Rhodopsin domain-containing protein n=1 Tax=Talaromyces islandicus TaxID=28573 RepID=A0A0U1M9B3_TALIS|nr:hypothetical protein PISL3812_09211 [Talaromyces islandicus]